MKIKPKNQVRVFNALSLTCAVWTVGLIIAKFAGAALSWWVVMAPMLVLFLIVLAVVIFVRFNA